MDCIASAIVDESARPQPPTGHTAASEPPIHPAAAETLRVVQEGLLAMQRLSQQTAEAHQRFLSAQEQAHRAIQQLLENQQRLLFGAEAPIAAPSAAPSAARTKPVPVLPSPSERDAPKPAGPRVPADAAVESVVLDVVCQKTGYPREMIELDMDIEADLGVDSIKRVEILAGVEERLPGWSGVRPDYMGSLRTLREIVAYIQAAPGDSRVASLQPTADTVSSDRSVGPPRPTGNTGESPQPANDSRVSSPQAPFAPAAPKPPAGQPDKNAFAETLLSVVSQLTGYPRELLNLDMDMEADLGIDSIKRVEILAAVESKMPGLPPVKPEYMGSLRTLREIAGYFYNEPEASVRASGLPSPAEQLHVEPSEPARLPLTSRSDVNGPRPGPTSDRESRQLESTPPAARISRSALRLVDLPSLSNGTVSIASGCEVWVTDDGAGLSREIVSALTAAGHSARLVAPEPSPADTPPSRIAGLILVAQPTEAVNPLWRTQREQLLKDAFALTKSLAGGFKQAAKQGGALLSTVARMDGAFGLAGGPFDPVQGGLAGLVKTAAREWPGVDCRAIDVSPDWPDSRAAAEAVVRELAGDGPIEVGLSPAGRRGLETLPEQVGSGPLPIGRDDVIVITGGARGVAAEAALALSRACAPKLVLFGRTPQPAEEPAWLAGLNEEAAIKKAIVLHDFAGQPKPSPAKVKAAFNRRMADREIRRNLERIAAAGATVAYHSLDVRDAAAVSAAMNDVRETLGPIRGLIHAAGVLEDRRIEDKTQPQFDAVFDTKVGGLRRLLDAVPLQDLKCLVLFSSVSGRFGNQGQVDYAMANEVLNKAAQRLAAALPSCRVVSINWGPWEGGMVTPALGREFERRGIDLIPLETGGRLLVDELRHGGGRAVEVLIGADTALNAHQGLQRKSGAGPHAARDAEFDSFSLAFERTLDADRHSFMLSHVLDGRPVLPAAVMLEWMAHAALHPNPGLILHGFDDFRVLKGVVLRDESAPLRFMTAKPRRSGSLVDVAVELRGPATPDAETVHARGAAVLTTELPAAPRFDLPADIAARPYERSPERVYAELLFHGEHFHGIEGVQGMSHGGMIARLRTAWPPARWMRDPLRSNWIADPLILDACFQLAVLWCLEEIGVPSLPSFVGRYRQYCTAFPREGVIAVLQVERSSQHSMTGSITLLDDAGRVAARLEGYECTADASLREAFRRRSVVLAGV